MQAIFVRHPESPSEAIEVLSSIKPVFTGPSQTRIFSHDHISRMMAADRRRPEWTWVATDDTDTILGAVAAMSPFDTYKGILVVDMHAASVPDVAEALYRQVLAEAPRLDLSEPLEMSIQFAALPDALADPTVRRIADAAERAGFTMLVVRRRFELAADSAPPPLPTDLVLQTPETSDDPRLLAMMTSIMTDTLDVHDRRSLATMSAEECARQSLDWYLESDPLEGFALAHTSDGTMVGLVIGSAWGSSGMGSVSFVGVHPEARGRGYAAELTSAMAHRLITQGVSTVVGDTDEANVPMGQAFERVGFVQTESRIDFVPTA